MDPLLSLFPRATENDCVRAMVTEYRIFAFTKAEQALFVAEIRDRGYAFTLSREIRNGTLVITSASPLVARAIRRVSRAQNTGYVKVELYPTPVSDDLAEEFHEDHLQSLAGDDSL